MRPEANFEAVIEAGRVILPQKFFKNLKEAAVASKRLRRQAVCTDSEQFWVIWKLFWIWPHPMDFDYFND